jgi:hypothetical protein
MTPKPRFEGLALWNVEVEEVSAGWFRLRAVGETGNLFEETGGEPEKMIASLRELEVRIQQSSGKKS